MGTRLDVRKLYLILFLLTFSCSDWMVLSRLSEGIDAEDRVYERKKKTIA